jgi:hypothetical protein
MMIGFFGGLVLLCGAPWVPILAQGRTADHPVFPKACFFFKPGMIDYTETGHAITPEEERIYTASVNQFYRHWCTSNVGTPQEKSAAADAMVAAWKRLWDRETPDNAVFHEIGSFDLLALLGVTHELPALMRTDAKFTSDWIADCTYTCFHFGGDPADLAQGKYILMQLRLRNNVLDNLKKEPAAEPVIKMLEDAKFTLVD